MVATTYVPVWVSEFLTPQLEAKAIHQITQEAHKVLKHCLESMNSQPVDCSISNLISRHFYQFKTQVPFKRVQLKLLSLKIIKIFFYKYQSNFLF